MGTKCKVVEDGGISSSMGVVRSNQFPRKNCDRSDCMLCFQKEGEKDVSCDKANESTMDKKK